MKSNVPDIINKIVSVREQVNTSRTDKESQTSQPGRSENICEIINTIVSSYHRNWNKDKFEFARSFLAKTWTGIPLPVLSICGHGTQEIRYSTYLAYFLDQTKSHGIGRRYLDNMLEKLNQHNIDTYQAIVESEKWLGYIEEKQRKVNCYCDIVITCINHIIFIEQKINSGESTNPHSNISQLLRYDTAIVNNPDFSNKNHIKIYLTPTGKISQNSSDWLSLSYVDLVDIGISILHHGELTSNARNNLIRFLLDIAMGPFQKEENTINELISHAEKVVMSNDFADRLKFDQLFNRNTTLVKLLMEG